MEQSNLMERTRDFNLASSGWGFLLIALLMLQLDHDSPLILANATLFFAALLGIKGAWFEKYLATVSSIVFGVLAAVGAVMMIFYLRMSIEYFYGDQFLYMVVKSGVVVALTACFIQFFSTEKSRTVLWLVCAALTAFICYMPVHNS